MPWPLRLGALAMFALSALGQVTVVIEPVSTHLDEPDQKVLRPLSVGLQDRLAQQVLKLPNVTVIDREHAKLLMREQHLAILDGVERSSANDIGRALHADALILVSFEIAQNSGLFSRIAAAQRWKASADLVEVDTGALLAKSVCTDIATESNILNCAAQIQQAVQPKVAQLWNRKQQQQAQAQNAAAALRHKEEDDQRAAAQEKAQALHLEETKLAEAQQRERTEQGRLAEAQQRERTEQKRLELQRIEQEKAEQEARAKLEAELERVRVRFSDLAGEANSMLEYWARIQQELRHQGGTLRSEIRASTARLRSDMESAEDAIKKQQLEAVFAFMDKARKEIDALEGMK